MASYPQFGSFDMDFMGNQLVISLFYVAGCRLGLGAGVGGRRGGGGGDDWAQRLLRQHMQISAYITCNISVPT